MLIITTSMYSTILNFFNKIWKWVFLFKGYPLKNMQTLSLIHLHGKNMQMRLSPIILEHNGSKPKVEDDVEIQEYMKNPKG